MKLNIHIFRKPAKRLWLWLLRKDALIFLLFVGLVSIFWWGRTMSSPRDIDLEVSLSYIGISEQVVFTTDLPHSLYIVVRDNGQQLRKIRHQDLHLTINLSTYLSEEKGDMIITTDILRPRLQDILPGSTVIQKINPEIIKSAYYIQQMKMVPVVVRSEVNVASQHQLKGEVKITPSQIQLFGSQADIDSIEYILTDSIYVEDLHDVARMNAQLIAPAGVRVSPTSVEVEWQAEQFTEKSFILPIQTIDVPNGKHMRLFPQQVNVTVRVGISHFASIQSEDLQAVCYYPKQQCNSIPIEVKTNNPHISNIRFSPTSVEYMIHSKL